MRKCLFAESRSSMLLSPVGCAWLHESHTQSIAGKNVYSLGWKKIRKLSICIFFFSDFFTLPISSAASILVECLRGVDVVTGVFISPAVKHLFELYC